MVFVGRVERAFTSAEEHHNHRPKRETRQSSSAQLKEMSGFGLNSAIVNLDRQLTIRPQPDLQENAGFPPTRNEALYFRRDEALTKLPMYLSG